MPSDFEQAPTLWEAFQAEAAAVPKLKVFGGTDDAPDSLGSEYLAARGFGADASGGVDGRAEEIAVLANSLSGVQANAHLDLLFGRLGAIAVSQCALHGDGAGQSAARRHKGGHEAVAERLDLPAAVRLHLLPQEIEMAVDDLLSGGIALARLEGRRADDIGKEDGDDAFVRLLSHRYVVLTRLCTARRAGGRRTRKERGARRRALGGQR